MSAEIYTHIHIEERGGHVFDEDVIGQGPVVVTVETNDDNDDGVPDGEVVRYQIRCASLDTAIKRYGRSRFGLYVQPVEVFVNGQRAEGQQ